MRVVAIRGGHHSQAPPNRSRSHPSGVWSPRFLVPDVTVPFPAERATIELKGASTANVHVTESLDRVCVSGASRLSYTGSPPRDDIETSGRSSISGE